MSNLSQMVTFSISKSLRKPLTLPNVNKWKVHHEDAAISGKVFCYTKSKGLFFERISKINQRFVTVTSSGFMIIYEKDNKGFVLDIKQAIALSTVTDTFATRKDAYRRCHLKLKFKFGTVNLFLINEDIHSWKTVVTEFHDGVKRLSAFPRQSEAKDTQTERCATKSVSQTTNFSAEPIDVDSDFVLPQPCKLSSEVSVEMKSPLNSSVEPPAPEPFVPSSFEFRSVTIAQEQDEARSNLTKFEKELAELESMFDDVPCMKMARTPEALEKLPSVGKSESSCSGLLTDISDTETSKTESVKSVRCGNHSVATLRRRLENKLNRRHTLQPDTFKELTKQPETDRKPEKHVEIVEVPVTPKDTSKKTGRTFSFPRRVQSSPVLSTANSCSNDTVLPSLPKVPPPTTPELNGETILRGSYESWNKSVRA